MSIIKETWESFLRAMIRYFDNKAIPDDNVQYLRMEIEKLKNEKQQLLDFILQPQAAPERERDEEQDWKPLNTKVPWHVKQRELEQASREKAIALAQEARINIAKAKTTAQLESELLTGTD